jgi:2,3-diaminopropionate biosynthesis protein SbnA
LGSLNLALYWRFNCQRTSEYLTMIYNNITDAIGDTPVVKLDCFSKYYDVNIYLKLESFNPTSSIKDRSGLHMIKMAEKEGMIKPGVSTIIESTSGNVGKSLAMAGAALGYEVILVVDPKASDLTIKYCTALGAKIELVTKRDKNGGYQRSRIDRVQQLLKDIPNSFTLDQYNNKYNVQAHEIGTAKELMHDFNQIDGISMCVSTGGHFTGISKALKKQYLGIKCLAVDSVGSSIFSSQSKPYLMNGIGLSWRPSILESEHIDSHLCVQDVCAFSICHQIALNTGMLIGGSGGAAIFGALNLARELQPGSNIVAVIPDSGMNYLNQFFDYKWLEEKGLGNMLSLDNIIKEISLSNSVREFAA